MGSHDPLSAAEMRLPAFGRRLPDGTRRWIAQLFEQPMEITSGGIGHEPGDALEIQGDSRAEPGGDEEVRQAQVSEQLESSVVQDEIDSDVDV